MMRLIALVVLTAVFCVGATFSYYNPGLVSINYLVGEFELPLGMALVAIFGATLLLTLLVGWVYAQAQRAEIRRLRRSLESTEAELKNLRNLPLQDR